ncbi:hypothetical protein SK128_002838 [Halocaridina rubra]|uniref:C2H2-type domain-containing protein n=1 Tax=Halocaridina rubra TaxID=373956 RepID=A0AAN8XJ27_HALRR
MSVFVAGEDAEYVPKTRTRKKYETKYSTKYENEYIWVGPSSKGETYAHCRWCLVDISIKSVGAKGLRDHEITGRHKQKASDQSLPPPPPPPPLAPLPPPPPQQNAQLNSAMYPVLEVEGGIEHQTEEILGLTHPISPQTPNTPLSPQEEEEAVDDEEEVVEETDLSHATSNLLDLGNQLPREPPLSAQVTPVYGRDNRKQAGSLVIEYDDPRISKVTQSNDMKSDFRGAAFKKEINGHIHVKMENSANNVLKKENSDNFPTATDDLTCNVCGRVYAVWTQLKQHLLEHIMAVQNSVDLKTKSGGHGRGRFSANRNSARQPKSQLQDYQNQPKEVNNAEKSICTKRRGRPPGSRNKVRSSDINVEVNQTMSKRPIRLKSNPKYSLLQEPDIDDPPMTESVINVTLSTENNINDDQDDLSDDGNIEAGTGDNDIESTTKRKSGPRQCRVCREIFYSRLELREHQRTMHNNGRPYQCCHCQKYFTTENHMEVHIKHKHITGPNPCQCAMCGKVLSSRTNLRIHMRIHKGERPYECPVCHKSFSRKANMEMHMVYHTGERRFTCEVCGQSFFAINALKRHAKLHTGERDYACEICGATYVTGTDLRRHRLKHDAVKPYPCQICEKQFTRSHDLKVHMRYHNRENRYTCDVCRKQFVESGNYKRHMRRHTGERPYTCGICLLTFSQVHHLKAHIKNNHSNETVIDDATQGPAGGRGRILPHRNPRIPSRRSHKPAQIQQQSSILPSHTHPHPQQHTHIGTSHPHGFGTGGVSMHTSQAVSPPVAHQGTVVPGSAAPSHTTQIPNSGSVNHPAAMTAGFLHQYNSSLYNHAVMPHYPTLFDMCPQQNCVNHLSGH